jgi:succinate dehydrogenase / fumarate reductase, flavoprotein subunit
VQKQWVNAAGESFPAYCFHTVIVGTGCAGLNAADRLYHYGQTDIALLTDHENGGTSRNTGSDKQTYYKLTLSGDTFDSAYEMAETLFSGQCVDGEHALCEAALSVPCFLRLCDLGVPFPQNRYGEYIGYKTDHDPGRRATSAGPLTSRLMTEALERSVKAKDIPLFDHRQVVSFLTVKGRVLGLVCLCTQEEEPEFELFFCQHIIYATGGPAGIYQDSCYPLGHTGMSGIAFEAGARGKNLTEWQYGLASVKPRWNVSGTFMQVLPRFISTDAAGGDVREFLQEYLPDPGKLLTLIFLKGYQWPFDVRKASKGSSLIDLIVYTETKVRGRRVFLDYTQNPLGDAFDMRLLDREASDYLERAGAFLDTPIMRLEHMNAPAVEFYRGRGVDLYSQPLEIALSSQHHNGGIAVDGWWQSTLQGLFVVGEAAGTHGVYRPGGSALNAGQVGAERAARYISKSSAQPLDAQTMAQETQNQIAAVLQLSKEALSLRSNVKEEQQKAMADMSLYGAAVRGSKDILALSVKVKEKLQSFGETIRIAGRQELPALFRYRDILLTQQMVLCAMADYVQKGGNSRGAALYTDPKGEKPLESLPEICRFSLAKEGLGGLLQEAWYEKGEVNCSWRPVRPIPREDDFFENVWRSYRENGNVY